MYATMRIFDGLTVFFVLITIGYIWLTTNSRTGIEWAGSTGLVLATLMLVFVGGYLHFVNARINSLPEDYEEAEVSDGAGELGFFPPGSIWPIIMATVILLVGFGLAFMNWWIILGGGVALVVGICGLVFQYYIGPEKH